MSSGKPINGLKNMLRTQENKMKLLLALLLLTVLFAGCAPGPNFVEKLPGEKAGFWKGIWHGLISPITFIISLFTREVRFYEIHNNGNWYNFGFVLGAGLFLSGGIFGRKKVMRKCR